VGLPWSKPDKVYRSPNVCALIEMFNTLSGFVCRTILCHENPAKRVKAISKWAKIVTFIRNNGSLNSMMVICSGLNRSAVMRLKDDFAAVPTKYKTLLTAAQTICGRERGYLEARKYIKNFNPPCVPYLGMTLTDVRTMSFFPPTQPCLSLVPSQLTFIEEGNPKFINGSLVNFYRCRSLANAIRGIQQYQLTPYRFEVVPAIREMLLSSVVVSDDDTMFKVSEFLVPRLGKQRGDRPAELDLFIHSTNSEGLASLGSPSEREVNQIDDWAAVDLEFRRGYPFYAADSPSSVRVDKDSGRLSAASITKIVERLTHHEHTSVDMLPSFLGAFRRYIAPQDLLELLLERSDPPMPKLKDQDLMKRYNQQVVVPVFVRSFNVLKCWLDTFWDDFSPEMLQRVEMWAYKLPKERDTFCKVILSSCERASALRKAIAEASVVSCVLDADIPDRRSLLSFGVKEVGDELRRLASILFVGLQVTDVEPHDPLSPASVARARYDAFLSNLVHIAKYEISQFGERAVDFIAELSQHYLLGNDVSLALSSTLLECDSTNSRIQHALLQRKNILSEIQNGSFTSGHDWHLLPLSRISSCINKISGKDMETATMLNVQKFQAVGQILYDFKRSQLRCWGGGISITSSNPALTIALRSHPEPSTPSQSSGSFRFSDCEVSPKDELRLLLIGMLDGDSELRNHVQSVVKDSVNAFRESLRQDIRRSISQSLGLPPAGEEQPAAPTVVAASNTEPVPYTNFSSTSASRQSAVRSLLGQLGKKSPSLSPAGSSRASPSSSPPRSSMNLSLQLDSLPENTKSLALSRISEQFPEWTRTQIKVPLLTRASASVTDVPIIELDAIYRKGGASMRDTLLLCIVRGHLGVEDVQLLLEIGKSFKMQNQSQATVLNCVVLFNTADTQASDLAIRAKVIMLHLNNSPPTPASSSSSSTLPS
jgi:hypothetical protein